MPDRLLERPSPLLASWLRIGVFAALYGGVAAASLKLAPGPTGLGSLWPASGLFVAVLILTPVQLRLFATAALGAAHFIGGSVGSTPTMPHLVFSAIIALEAWIAAAVIGTIDRRSLRFDRLADVGRLFFGGCVLAGGTAGVVAGAFAAATFHDPFLQAWRDWWLPDAVGMLVVTPLVLRVSSEPAWRDLRLRRTAEALALMAMLFAMTAYIFYSDRPRVPLSVGVLPFLVWAALRFGVAGISTASFTIWVVATFATMAGLGPFVALGDAPASRLAWSHVYVAVTGGLVLAIAAAIAERQAVGVRLARSVDELRDAYTRVQTIIASAPDMIGAIDSDFRVIAFNPAWGVELRRFGRVDASIGLDIRGLLNSIGSAWSTAALGGWERALAGERFAVQRGPEVLGSLRQMFVEFSPIRDDGGRIIGAVQLLRDVTDERRRQEAEAQARRFESVGQLAGGIAHDFNNIITGILSYASLLEQSLDPGDERRVDVLEIERAAGRAAELTAQLLAYARRQVVEPRVVDPNAQVEEAERLLRRLVGEGLTFSLDLAPEIWSVLVDPASLEQVLVNLAINARDSMPGGGVLRMATTNMTMRADDLPQRASGAGDYVRIDVSDTGHGIPRELLDHIFEPFFTTKDVGKGTGLGLASAFGILQQFGGAIGVESVAGHGTTFSVYLPRAVGEPPVD